MYYSSPAPISPSSRVGELLCPGCELCCDVIYCGELKFANDYNVRSKEKKRYKKDRNCIASTKIVEAIRDVQQRTLDLQRKLVAMEKVKSPTSRPKRKEERLSKLPITDHRSCYCPNNPSEDIRKYTQSEPMKPETKEHEEETVKEREKSRVKVQEETQTETTTSNPTTEKKSSKPQEDPEEGKDTKRGSFFGGCAPCGLTCGFRYERNDDSTPSDVSRHQQYREKQKCRGGCGPGSSRRRLTGVRSFPGGKSTPRRTWCCCPCGM